MNGRNERQQLVPLWWGHVSASQRGAAMLLSRALCTPQAFYCTPPAVYITSCLKTNMFCRLQHVINQLLVPFLRHPDVLQAVDVSHERMTFSVSVAASMDELMKIWVSEGRAGICPWGIKLFIAVVEWSTNHQSPGLQFIVFPDCFPHVQTCPPTFEGSTFTGCSLTQLSPSLRVNTPPQQ